MRFLALALVAALAGTAVGKQHEPEHDPEAYRDTEMVLIKSEKQFLELKNTHRVFIVNFSKQLPECIKNKKYEGEPIYCDFVTRAKSKFREVSKMLRHSRGGQIATLARVDCEHFSQLCEEEGISTYPTLKAYSRTRPYEVFTGTPTVAFVAAFVERVAFNTIRQIVDEITAKSTNQITPSDKTIQSPPTTVPATPACGTQPETAADGTEAKSKPTTATTNENVANDVITDMESMHSDIQGVASLPEAPFATEEPKNEKISYTKKLLHLIGESDHPRLVALLVVFLVGVVILGVCTCVLACMVRNRNRHSNGFFITNHCKYSKMQTNQNGESVYGPMVSVVRGLVRRESKEALLPSYADAVAESPEVRKKLEVA
eukprot:comp18459_c0_seq1/m.19762 comp18459_c0_seq1/g.19762  ORF comp18459_c0_seq1/g.19762 comp18459_c0_seq1/m.19762 type:complete len:374 (-) comp18459_c0_seq1:76-1197(-)